MSRSSAFITAVLVSVLSLATAAWANTPEPPAVTVAADPVGAAILDRLDRLKAARGRTDAERALVEQIAAFYRGRDLAPVWGDGATIGAKAAATIDELRLAGDFGLDPVQFDLPKLAVSLLAPAEYADIEARLSFAVVKYASHAAGGRIAPVQLSKWLDQRPGFVNAAAVLRSVADAADPAAALRRTHPQHAGFERLRQAWLAARGKSAAVIVAVADAPIPMGRKLNVWDENPDVPVIRRRLGLKDRPQAAEEYDDAMAKAVRALRRELGRPVNGVIDDGIRRVLNARSSAALPATAAKNPELAK